MISPNFATMLCFVETDAGAQRRDRRPAARRVRQALLRPRLRRRAAVDQRHRDPDLLGLERRARRARERGRAALRRGARRAAAPARDHDGRRRRGRRGGSPACVVRGGERRTASRRSRAPSRTRRSSRPRCTAATPTGGGSSRPSARALRGRDRFPRRSPSTSSIEGIPVCSAGAAIPYDEAALARGRRRRARSNTRSTLPGEGAETEVFFSDLSHEYVTINADYTT